MHDYECAIQNIKTIVRNIPWSYPLGVGSLGPTTVGLRSCPMERIRLALVQLSLGGLAASHLNLHPFNTLQRCSLLTTITKICTEFGIPNNSNIYIIKCDRQLHIFCMQNQKCIQHSLKTLAHGVFKMLKFFSNFLLIVFLPTVSKNMANFSIILIILNVCKSVFSVKYICNLTKMYQNMRKIS